MKKRIGVAGALLFFLLFATGINAQKTASMARIQTPYGNIWIALFDETPAHKVSFMELAQRGYWDSLTFNRVIPDFVIQGGCPDTEQGFTDSSLLLKPEFVPTIRHKYGAVAAGRDNNPQKLSARCQFYIVQNQDGLARLDDNYTVFGQVVSGMEVVNHIAHLPRDANDQPLQPVTMDVDIVQVRRAKFDRWKGKMKKGVFPAQAKDSFSQEK